jgi:putative transposase
LTFKGVPRRSSNVSSHAHERKSTDGRVRELGARRRIRNYDVIWARFSGGLRTRGKRKSRPDHVHMLLSIPPKYAVSQVVGYIKGKSAIHLARVYGERKRNFVGRHFWARGFFVNTVGRDEDAIRAYIRNQEKEDQRLEQMKELVPIVGTGFREG